MGILSVVLLVFFVMVAFLLVLLVLVQNEEGDSLGGIFAGGSSSAFGSRSGNVLTRATSVLGALFLILSFGLALINRTPAGSGVEAAGAAARQQAGEVNRNWWQEDEPAPALETPGAETPISETSDLEVPNAETEVPEAETPEPENPDPGIAE